MVTEAIFKCYRIFYYYLPLLIVIQHTESSRTPSPASET